MPQIINTNLSSINAQRNLNGSQSSTAKALQRLSSGLRINSAKDDAAGLAISTRFTTQTRGLAVAVRNASDGVSLAQTAEGALGTITDSLQRIRELALQATNGTNSDEDRQALNAEARQLIAEIKRTAESANFNGRKLLDGSFDTFFQVGTSAGEGVNVNIAKVTTDTLGVSQSAGISSTTRYGTTANIATQKLTNGDLTINGVSISASTASDDPISYRAKDTSAIAMAAAINRQTELTSVAATVNKNVMAGASMTPAAQTGTLTINGVTTTTISTTADGAASRASVVSAINAIAAQTGVQAVDSGEDATGILLVAEDGRNISVLSSAATFDAAVTGIRLDATNSTTEVTQSGSVTLRSSTGGSIEIDGDADLETNSGLVRAKFEGQAAQASSASHVIAAGSTGEPLDAGDLVINGVTIGGAKTTDDTASSEEQDSSVRTGSAIAIATAINRVSGNTGVTATANANIVRGTQTTTATVGDDTRLRINGFLTSVVTSTADQASDRRSTVDAINAIAGQTGVTAKDTGDGIQLTAEDGRNISVLVANDADGPVTNGNLALTSIGLNGASGVTAVAGADVSAGTATVGSTAYGTVTLRSGGPITVRAGSGGVDALEAIGFRVGDFGATSSGQLLDEVDISTVDGANKSLAAIDNALAQVNAERAKLGAMQNRFEATMSNLSVNAENLEAANSRIRDADFAMETANLSRGQVLQQAGISILAQANALNQNVLKLLQ